MNRVGGSSAPIDGVAARIAAGAFVLVDKPRGPSSHQVTAWVRNLLGVPRAGHSGTLDPNVSGVLWIGLGPALKLLPLMLEFPKRYVGLVSFHAPVDAKDLARVVGEFTGPIFQTPPVRSAVRRERRVRTIHRLTVLERRKDAALLDVVADSGTYVRTLAVDLGEALGVGAHLAELRRIGTGPFLEEAATTLSALSDAVAAHQAGNPAALLALLHPMEEAWREFPTVVLKDAASAAVAHGAGLAAGGIVSVNRPFAEGARVVLVERSGALVAFGRALVPSDRMTGRATGWMIRPERVFADAAEHPPLWRPTARTPKHSEPPAEVP